MNDKNNEINDLARRDTQDAPATDPPRLSTGKREQIWRNAAQWCEDHPGKTHGIYTPRGMFTLTYSVHTQFANLKGVDHTLTADAVDPADQPHTDPTPREKRF